MFPVELSTLAAAKIAAGESLGALSKQFFSY